MAATAAAKAVSGGGNSPRLLKTLRDSGFAGGDRGRPPHAVFQELAPQRKFGRHLGRRYPDSYPDVLVPEGTSMDVENGWRIRPSRPADAQAMAGIRTAVAEREGPATRPDPGRAANSPLSLVAEAGGRPVGYTDLVRWDEVDGTRLYLVLGLVEPAWRRRGIGTALLARQEQQAAELDAGRSDQGAPTLGANVDEGQDDARDLLLRHGFTVAFTGVKLVTEPVPAAAPAPMLPAGLRLRPVCPEHHPKIHRTIVRCFADSRLGHTGLSYDEYLADVVPDDLELWQVAWAGDDVVGLVISQRQRDGELDTPWVAVVPEWRGHGVASALLRRSLHAMAARGTTRAWISTVEENPHDTVGLYSRLGYRVVRRHPKYRKPLPPAR